MNTTRTRIIVIAGALLVVVAIVLVVMSAGQSISALNSGTLKVTLVPADAQITADGKAVTLSKNSDLTLPAGNHNLTFSRSGFDSKTITVNITKQHTTNQTVILKANSQAARDYLKAHGDQQAILDRIGEEEAQQHGQAITQNAPLIQILPYHGGSFDIDFGASQKYKDDAHAAAIYITADTPQARTAAVEWIKAQGYDPAGYEIIYQTYAGAR
jgi:hypothetical protein